MATLTINLLGAFQVNIGRHPAAGFESDKVRALLAYISVEATQSHRREKLAALLWPEMPEAMARGNLRHALANLRQVIHDHDQVPPYLFISRQAIQFNPQSDHLLDVTEFSKNEITDQQTLQPPNSYLEDRLTLYRGDFLDGFSIADSVEFEEWMLVKREKYRLQMGNTLKWMVKAYMARGQYARAIPFARKHLEMQPWDESVHQQLIRLLALDDQRSAALAQYEKCRQILSTELGVVPTISTRTLYEHIRDERWPDETAKKPLPLFMVEERENQILPLLVARDRELRLLRGLLNQARVGNGQFAFITGEAGTGKTALMQYFAQQAMDSHPNLLVAQGKCSAYTGSGDPYLPFRQIMQELTGDVEANWQAGDMSTDHARRLWAAMPEVIEALVINSAALLDRFVPGKLLLTRAQIRMRGELPENSPWLAQLLHRIQAGEIITMLSQTDLFEQYTRLLEVVAGSYPLLLLLDDLQWIDNGSLNLLFHLSRNLQTRPILILGAYRPGDVAHIQNRESHPFLRVVAEIDQNFGHNQVDLGRSGGRPFIDALLDNEPNRLGEEFRRDLLHQTGGQALFTTELLLGLQERGDLIKDEEGYWVESAHFDWDILPSRVEAVIATRVSRLPFDDRQALTVASVEGETFTAEVVAHVQNIDEHELVQNLSGNLGRRHHLVRAQSSHRSGRQRFSRYRFHHFLIQKYLYDALDPVEQAELHESVGDALEVLYGDQESSLATIFGQLAWHYQKAGVLEKAIAYCLKAGERAWQLSAAAESITHFRQGLHLLQKMPDSSERRQMELNLLIGLMMPLQAAHGFAAPEVQQTCDQAFLLSQQVGQTPQLFSVLGILGSYYLTSGQFHVGLKISRQAFELGQRFQDPLKMALADLEMAANFSQLGEFTQSVAHLEQLMDFYDYREHHVLVPHFSIDPGVNGLIWLALIALVQGFPERAERYRQEAIDIARVLEHGLSLAAAYEVSGGILHILERNYAGARKDLEESLKLADAQNFGLFQVEGKFYEGFLLVADGRIDQGIAQMKASLAGWRQTGMRIMYTVMLGLLAEALCRAGQISDGLQMLEKAFTEVDERDERFFVAELYRIKGDLLQGNATDPAVIETAYHQAITLAQQQSAKLWELRASISLAKYYRSQDQVPQAGHILSEIYDWFSEGFDSPDMMEALALIVDMERNRLT